MKSVKSEEVLGFILLKDFGVSYKEHKIVGASPDIFWTINFSHNFTLWHSWPHTYSMYVCMYVAQNNCLSIVCLSVYK